MTGLTFKTMRRFYGLPAREAAMSLGVTEKTVRNWEASGEVPEKAIAYMRDFGMACAFAETQLRKAVGKPKVRFVPCPPDMNDAIFFFPAIAGTFMPWTAFRRAVGGMCAVLGAEAAPLSRREYAKWLDGREDSVRERENYLFFVAEGGSC